MNANEFVSDNMLGWYMNTGHMQTNADNDANEKT